MDNIVKWFTLAIVCVFDPLAVALVLAYNSLIEGPKPKKTIIQSDKDDNVNIHYRDK